VLFDQQGRYPDAMRHARMAFDLHLELGDRRGQAAASNLIGWCLARLGSYAEAASHCLRALAEHRATGDEDGEAEALDSLGLINHHLGRYGQAVTDLEEALRLFRQGGDRYAQAQVLDHLGDTRVAAGEEPLARAAWRESLAILHELAHPDADTMRAKLDELV